MAFGTEGGRKGGRRQQIERRVRIALALKLLDLRKTPKCPRSLMPLLSAGEVTSGPEWEETL